MNRPRVSVNPWAIFFVMKPNKNKLQENKSETGKPVYLHYVSKYGEYQVILTTTNYAIFLLLYLLEKYLHI